MNGLADGIIEFKSGKEITEKWEMFDGPMEGSVGYFNPTSVFPLCSKFDSRDGQMQHKQPIAQPPPPKLSAQNSIAEQLVK